MNTKQSTPRIFNFIPMDQVSITSGETRTEYTVLYSNFRNLRVRVKTFKSGILRASVKDSITQEELRNLMENEGGVKTKVSETDFLNYK